MAHQRLPAPPGVWTPTPLPPRGQIRTNGEDYVFHLPACNDDWAPWHQLTPAGESLPPLTHKAVYGTPWRILGSLLPLLHEQPAGKTAADPAPAVYHRGDACPADLAGVILPDGSVWARDAWETGLWPTWNDLLALGPVVGIPVQQLLDQSAVSSQPAALSQTADRVAALG